MHTAGHPAQQAFGRIRRLLDKMVHIVPAGEVEIAAQLAVKRVLHGHIHHDAALIHHRIQLFPHLVGGAVDTGEDARTAPCRRVELIASGRGVDLGACGPQQGHIAHHDLPGHSQRTCQHTGAQGGAGLRQPL